MAQKGVQERERERQKKAATEGDNKVEKKKGG
jgi:hypothetical protein